MNFSSIKEYFYKSTSYCFLIVLLPVIFFALIYNRLIALDLGIINFNDSLLLPVLFLGIELIALTIVQLCVVQRLKKIAKQPGLAMKLDAYFALTMIRIVVGALFCLVTVLGYLLTQNQLMDVLFFVTLAYTFFQFPTSRKTCIELKLRGDEREMVYYKKDRF